jgi:glutamate transport system permease protein
LSVVLDNFSDVLRAFGYTALLFVISAVLSLALGTFLAAMRVGPVKVLAVAGGLYVTLVRNTPLVIIFMFFTYAAPKIGLQFQWVDVTIAGFDLKTAFATAIVALTLYTSTFVCEAIRSGINSVPIGQAEAARAIGLPFGGVMTQVVLPQAVRASLPPTASTLIAMLKNTSVAGIFFVAEAIAQMRRLTNDNADQRLGIFVAFAIGYIILVEIVSVLSQLLERRWRVA